MNNYPNNYPEENLVYVPNHPALQAAAQGLAKCAGLNFSTMSWYLPIALAELLGATHFRPDGNGQLVADWPQHWFPDWQYDRPDGQSGLVIGWDGKNETAS